MKGIIDRFLDAGEDLPPAPATLPQLLQALQQADSDLGPVVDMIAFDPALTAKVLRTCNSALLGRSAPVNDVAEAVARLGFRTVYRVVAAVNVSATLGPSGQYGLDVAALWRHCVTVAFAAQFIAEEARVDSGLLFTAGLLHDVGKVVLARAFKQDYSRLISDKTQTPKEIVLKERLCFKLDHAELGGGLLERWKFSPEFALCVRFHHNPAAAGDAQRPAACLNLADILAHSQSDNKDEERLKILKLEPQSALSILELTEDHVARHRDRIRENLEFVEAMSRLRS
jgi:putative nucleotidyltransferase with HDIG domain